MDGGRPLAQQMGPLSPGTNEPSSFPVSLEASPPHSQQLFHKSSACHRALTSLPTLPPSHQTALPPLQGGHNVTSHPLPSKEGTAPPPASAGLSLPRAPDQTPRPARGTPLPPGSPGPHALGKGPQSHPSKPAPVDAPRTPRPHLLPPSTWWHVLPTRQARSAATKTPRPFSSRSQQSPHPASAITCLDSQCAWCRHPLPSTASPGPPLPSHRSLSMSPYWAFPSTLPWSVGVRQTAHSPFLFTLTPPNPVAVNTSICCPFPHVHPQPSPALGSTPA